MQDVFPGTGGRVNKKLKLIVYKTISGMVFTLKVFKTSCHTFDTRYSL